ncbi:DUF1488 family protein [Paraburkholderia kururiensis]|uniref:DUF1488 family protein n=1 Tax=Paraburkholderia kururiensis TaxID=984307 RepID=UPI0005A6A0A5|nr:DUF1488 family protein [Paraburkholderia kururiensis]
METLEREPGVSPDGRTVVFFLSSRGRDIECAITRDALEQHFWVQPGDSELRVLKAFTDGRKRIVAVAGRKVLTHPGERVVLTVADFGVRK